MKLLTAALIVAFTLSACAPAATLEPPAATTAPTETPAPTATPKPTSTRAPTFTPRPTNTPRPTLTPAPPTETPAPVTLAGSGDAVVDFDGSICPCVAHITGNTASNHFAVKNFDSGGSQIDLLVNTTDPYDGRVPVDFLDAENTTRFQVTARGDWSITAIPLETYVSVGRVIVVPGELSGIGDDVVVLLGDNPDTAIIVGNKNARYFAVIAWGGNGRDLLVNTTDVYGGQVVVSQEAFLLQVRAEGEWLIEVKGR